MCCWTTPHAYWIWLIRIWESNVHRTSVLTYVNVISQCIQPADVQAERQLAPSVQKQVGPGTYGSLSLGMLSVLVHFSIFWNHFWSFFILRLKLFRWSCGKNSTFSVKTKMHFVSGASKTFRKMFWSNMLLYALQAASISPPYGWMQCCGSFMCKKDLQLFFKGQISSLILFLPSGYSGWGADDYSHN